MRVVEAAEASGRLLQIGHVLRYTPFYEKVHEIVQSGRIGELVHLDLKEHVAQWHMTPTVRARKVPQPRDRRADPAGQAADVTDLLAWLVDRPAVRVASFGALTHYRGERAPAGAPPRCTDGCPVQAECPHDAVAFYTGPDDAIARAWPWSDVSPDPSRAARRRALEERSLRALCLPLRQRRARPPGAVALEFEGGVTASFGLHGLAANEQRTIRVTGTRGELRGLLDGGEIEVSRAGALGVERFEIEGSGVRPLRGGDPGLMAHFSDLLQSGSRAVRASGRAALESHLIGFAAEQAREQRQVVDMRRLGAARVLVSAGLPLR